jgi:mannose-1-phosphate guanylyltransferase
MKLYPVIMAGGSGTRFWPLSRKARPKQFLPLVSAEPLIAETAKRLKGLAPLGQTYVVCGPIHARAVKAAVKGLPPKNILVEPVARNTAPAIGLACLAVAARDPEGVLVVLPSDHHVGDVPGFQSTLKKAAVLAEQGHLVTLGIAPTRPETGYGYIERGDPLGAVGFKVRSFKEKPDLVTAGDYLKTGDFYWNAGIFVFQAKAMLKAFEAHSPELAQGLAKVGGARKSQSAKVLGKVFTKLPSVSVDYAVMEKADNIAVVPGDFGWSDVGSFAALDEVREKDAQGNVVSGKGAVVIGSSGCVVLAKDRPLAVVGMVDTVVVDAGDAVLVVPKARCQDVRAAVEALKAKKLDQYA